MANYRAKDYHSFSCYRAMAIPLIIDRREVEVHHQMAVHVEDLEGLALQAVEEQHLLCQEEADEVRKGVYMNAVKMRSKTPLLNLNIQAHSIR